MTGGCEVGGNKIRKLEFLLADALDGEYDSVVTIGGEQSNHCRATAAACRMVGLEPYLILRTKRANQVEKDRVESGGKDSLGYVGNILFDRMVGSQIYTCTPGEYGRVGSKALVDQLCHELASSKQKKAYPIPVGGSNGLGSWGYIEGVNEFIDQLNGEKVDHVVFACGSGGTAAGITLGFALAYNELKEEMPSIHAVAVCDDPDYFYNEVANIGNEMGLDLSIVASAKSKIMEEFVKDHVTVHQGKGLGYASSTKEELDFITTFSMETGIVLDPVYSGKALYQFMKEVHENPDRYRDSRVVFWHTGGSLGQYDKIEALASTLEVVSPVKRLDVYGTRSKGLIE